MLKMITSPLMDLHGQFQHQELLKQSIQLKTLDEFGVKEIETPKNEFKERVGTYLHPITKTDLSRLRQICFFVIYYSYV